MREKLANLPQELVDDLKEIAARMEGQDNYGTAHPIYCVQSLKRVYGLIPEYAESYEPEYVFNNDTDFRFKNHDELIKYLEGEDNTEGYTEEDFTAFYYTDVWEDEQWFFTEQAAKDFIKSNGHRYEELRMYVKSLYRNYEMQAVVKLLKYLRE